MSTVTPQTLSQDDHVRVTAAIKAAEKTTNGEIYCVLARSSDSYFYPAAFTLSIAMLVVSIVAAYALEYWWYGVQLHVFVAAQVLALGSALSLLWALPGMAIWLVPAGLKYRRAHANAARQFLARNVHRTRARTGVLLFVSLAERYAEVLADAGINEMVGQETWDKVVTLLITEARHHRHADGFVAAIEVVGNVLALHFPVSEGDINELDDHLVEI
ncbi:TPM domain-containing protein [Mesorhizobium sp. NBSH29]|uniref:TPM domain-containing protein n=1 Tax=Mesorhizobium sp. NBSH29 TaxID=2654249 RepID=UPI001896684E|nr:TPM domain-containing protein [Mesorhizobium sp. NBSH29]QPC85879.1 TPM domain-containing protein [Mesorhizobium sp. NBSH29]